MFEIEDDPIDFAVGDIIVCIDDTPNNGMKILVRGQKYTIRQMSKWPDGDVILILDEQIGLLFKPVGGGWLSSRFRLF
jgi:hypothetical protein